MTDTLLATIAPLVGIMARERTVSAARPELYEDARQEGLIRAWTVAAKHPDKPKQYVVAAARNGVGDILRGRPAFGATSHRGTRDAADSATALTVVHADGDESTFDVVDPTASAAMDRAELAGNRREVRSAVSALTPRDRQLVALRFSEGLQWAEVAAVLGVRSDTAQKRFKEHIAPALRAELAHLEELAA